MDAIFCKVLNQYETILWVGKPKQGVMLTIVAIPGLLIATVQLLVSLFLFIKLVEGNIHYDFMALTGVFVVYSVLTFYAAIFADSEFRRRTNYAVTDRRILIHYGYKSNKLKTFSPKLAIPELPPQAIMIKDLPEVVLQYVAEDGNGTIEFGLPAIYNSFWGVRGGGPVIRIYPRLEYIEHVEDVYKLIQSVKSKTEGHADEHHKLGTS